jgi:hypothetical protein
LTDWAKALPPGFIPDNETAAVKTKKNRTDSMPGHFEHTRARRPQPPEIFTAPPSIYP